ncbi:MAG: hypothetical protein IPH21_15820 [Flavobacteriales bacterium]|nr:hypothetical protein [Flavobacteriales bacterium]
MNWFHLIEALTDALDRIRDKRSKGARSRFWDGHATERVLDVLDRVL